ncbi:hypothetical protein [Deinococcus alpinitundrae]|nr:hypothetical protein [Deinococcus alpinitundrae]
MSGSVTADQLTPRWLRQYCLLKTVDGDLGVGGDMSPKLSDWIGQI